MLAVRAVIRLALLVLELALLGRMIISWVPMFVSGWRPRGIVLVVCEAVFTVTDPPLRWLRRVIPGITVGGVRLDLAFTVLFLVVVIALRLV